jgi:hypothetical protein
MSGLTPFPGSTDALQAAGERRRRLARADGRRNTISRAKGHVLLLNLATITEQIASSYCFCTRPLRRESVSLFCGAGNNREKTGNNREETEKNREETGKKQGSMGGRR